MGGVRPWGLGSRLGGTAGGGRLTVAEGGCLCQREMTLALPAGRVFPGLESSLGPVCLSRHVGEPFPGTVEGLPGSLLCSLLICKAS